MVNYLSSFVYALFVLHSLPSHSNRLCSGRGALFHPRFEHEDANHLEFTAYATAWIVSLVYDAVVFCLTVNKSLKLGWSNPRTLWRVMLQDGTFHSLSEYHAATLRSLNLPGVLGITYFRYVAHPLLSISTVNGFRGIVRFF